MRLLELTDIPGFGNALLVEASIGSMTRVGGLCEGGHVPIKRFNDMFHLLAIHIVNLQGLYNPTDIIRIFL